MGPPGPLATSCNAPFSMSWTSLRRGARASQSRAGGEGAHLSPQAPACRPRCARTCERTSRRRERQSDSSDLSPFTQPAYLTMSPSLCPPLRRKSHCQFLIFCMRARRSGGGDVPLGRGGLAGRKCARRAARGAPGVLCARSTSRMVVGKAPVAARRALRALKPRVTPWRRGQGSVA